jgi:hypothetical protein
MSRDLDIENTVEDGKRNQEAKELIHNWCRHARVEKFGGTGLIEQATGLPIGHHAMVCDYAEGGWSATWLLEEAALRFHDVNCVGCTKRVPVRLPNISMLLARREREQELAQAEAYEANRKSEAALQARKDERTKVRALLSGASLTFLDDLHVLDRERSDTASLRLIESARLAPEILVPPLMDHLFSLLESGEHWFDLTGLPILAEHATDQSRLTRCAMKLLSTGDALGLATDLVANRADLVVRDEISEAVVGLAYVAAPPPPEYPGSQEKEPKPDALLQLAARFREEVARGLRALLADRRSSRVGIAARALSLLISKDPWWVNQFVRSLAGHLSRLDALIDAERDSVIDRDKRELKKAVATAFLVDPDLTDSELMRQFESASEEGEGRLASVYEYVVSRMDGGRSKERVILRAEPFKVALRRIVALAESSENIEVLNHLLSALRHPEGSLVPIARDLMDLFLGGAAVVDSRLQESPSTSPLETPHNPIEIMERQNRRSSLWYVRNALIGMAMHGARKDHESLSAIESFLKNRTALGDSFGAAIIQEVAPLLETNAGLRALLPHLYTAMVGPSTMGRAAAAHALEKLGDQRFAELPELVADALLQMLMDPYVIVHKAAVAALGRVRLPARLRGGASHALRNLVAGYRDSKDQEFLLECMEALGRNRRGDPQFATQDGRVLMALLENVKPDLLLRSGHTYFLRSLSEIDGYGDLALKLLARSRGEHQIEHALDLVNAISPATLGKHRAGVLAAVAANPAEGYACGMLIEILTRGGEWEVATQVASLRVDAIPDTPRERSLKLFARQLQLRAQFEEHLAKGQIEDALATGQAWHDAAWEIEEIRTRHEKSDSF